MATGGVLRNAAGSVLVGPGEGRQVGGHVDRHRPGRLLRLLLGVVKVHAGRVALDWEEVDVEVVELEDEVLVLGVSSHRDPDIVREEVGLSTPGPEVESVGEEISLSTGLNTVVWRQ